MRTTIFKIIEAVGARERKEYAASKLQHEPEKGNGKKRGQSFGHKTGKTVREFLEAIDQKLIAEGKGGKGKPNAGLKGLKLQREVRDPAAVIAFDKSYKQYIYSVFIRKFGFKPSEYKIDDNGNPETGHKNVFGKVKLDLECVYHDVLARLLLGAMDGFDMNQPRVGKGA
ncbi:MAG: hypothetical protein IKU71_06170, partial [Kiritimatiellae bacterium]|nr:hypothetical protein [Kiritimatiellia bacterium]